MNESNKAQKRVLVFAVNLKSKKKKEGKKTNNYIV